MPAYKLKGIKLWIKDVMPLTYKIVAGKGKYIPCWFQNSLELFKPVSRIKDGCVPLSNIIVKILSP